MKLRLTVLLAGALALTSVASAADIVDTAVAGNFTTLVAAVKAAGLVDTLKGPGPFTVFAPTDEAFAKLPARHVGFAAQAGKQGETAKHSHLSRHRRQSDGCRRREAHFG